MNLIELKDKLYWSNVPDRWYSLNEGLKPDACILYKNYSKWEFFYMNEKGDMKPSSGSIKSFTNTASYTFRVNMRTAEFGIMRPNGVIETFSED